MRYHQFITEDRLTVTANNFGAALLNRLVQLPDITLPEGLSAVYKFLLLAQNYKQYAGKIGQARFFNIAGHDIMLKHNEIAQNGPQIVQQYVPEIINLLVTKIQRKLPGQIAKYLPWVVREYSNGNIKRYEDIGSRISPLLSEYIQMNRRGDFPAAARDIMRLSAEQFESIMTQYKPAPEQLKNRGQAKTFLDNSNVRIIVPGDETAACYYGQGTRWCTAGKSYNQFTRYNNEGPLYILLPKQPQHNGEKYQLYFGSNPSQIQFMDENDNSIDVHWLLTERFPELWKTFAKSNPEVISEDNILFTSHEVLSKIAKIIGNYIIDLGHENAVEQEIDDEEWDEIRGRLSDIEYFDASDIINNTNNFVSDYFNTTNDLPDINIPDLPFVYAQLLDYNYSEAGNIGNLLQERLWITDNKNNVNGTVLGKAGKWIIGHSE